jgi:xylulokinase
MLCALADGLDALIAEGAAVNRVILIGGGARSEAVRRIAPEIFGCGVVVPEPGEYVADGAARQAAWVVSDQPAPPAWATGRVEHYDARPVPAIRDQYAAVRELVHDRPA